MFNKLLNTVVYHTAFATGFACHKTAKTLRVTADKLDVAGQKCGEMALKHGIEAGLLTMENNVVTLKK